MMVAAFFAAGILFVVAIVHAGWAFGMNWPAKDEQTLIKTVIGHPDIKKMPNRYLTLVVALAITLAGLCALVGAEVIMPPLPNWMIDSALVILALIFAARGASSYVTDGPLGQRVEPFATLDRRYFAPLCLLLSACYGIIFFS